MPSPVPMRLLRIPDAFDHPDFIFEPKNDGFRALAQVDEHRCTLVSRHGHVFNSWPQLAEEIAQAVRASRVVLDGEICCLEPDGRSHLNKLLFRREWPHFYAFDILAHQRRDLTRLPLMGRKRILLGVLPSIDCRLLYLDHVAVRGRDLFRAACDRDLGGIVGKWSRGTYQADGRGTSWLKIKNPDYSQSVDRHELFEGRTPARRGTTARRPELRLA